MGECARFVRLGQRHPAQACFVHCSPECADWAAAGYGGLDTSPPLPPNGDAFDYVTAGAPWMAPEDEALMVPTPTGRIKPLTSASYSDLKNFLYGTRGSKFVVDVKGKPLVLEEIKIREVTPAQRDAITAAVYAEVRVALQAGLAPERRASASAAPAWSQPKFAVSARRRDAGLPPGVLLPDKTKRERVLWGGPEEAALRAGVAKHGAAAAAWPGLYAEIKPHLHPKRSMGDCKTKWRMLTARDAGRAEPNEDEDANDDEDMPLAALPDAAAPVAAAVAAPVAAAVAAAPVAVAPAAAAPGAAAPPGEAAPAAAVAPAQAPAPPAAAAAPPAPAAAAPPPAAAPPRTLLQALLG